RHTVERLAGKLQRGKRVLDRRFLRIVRDRFDLGLVCGKGSLENRAEILVLQLREIGQAERSRPVRERMSGEIDGSHCISGELQGAKVEAPDVGTRAAPGNALTGYPGRSKRNHN